MSATAPVPAKAIDPKNHRTWPAVLKLRIAARLLMRRFHPWRTNQDVWEEALRDAYGGLGAHTGAGGSIRAAALDLLLGRAAADARAWKAAGFPIERPPELAALPGFTKP